MPSGKYLTESERAVIDELHGLGLSATAIGKRIKRSQCVISSFLKKGDDYGKKKRTYGNTKITNRQRNQLIQLASQDPVDKNLTLNEMIRELGLPIKKHRAAKILKSTGYFKYTKKMRQPFLKAEHEKARLEWAREHISWKKEWDKVVFTDEKKFNLDGPDGFACYWHDLRKEPQYKYSRNFGGGSLMVWAGFSKVGKTQLAKISCRMKSKDYNDMLEDIFIPFSEDMMPDEMIFMQDNASIHVSRESKNWFEARNIELLKWPARSPDLNPIENLWGILARDVYGGGKQYGTVQELEVAVRNSSRNIRLPLLEKLVDSMPGRLFELVQRNGKQLHN